MAGKTFRQGRVTRIVADGQELSCFLKEGNLTSQMDTLDTTAFCDTIKQYDVNLPSFTFAMSGFFDSTDTGADTVFMHRFGRELVPASGFAGKMQVILANEGLAVGRRSRSFEMIPTSYGLTNTVADMVAFSSQGTVIGQLYTSTNVTNFATAFTNAAGTQTFNRGTTGNLGVTNYTGYIITAAYNGTTTGSKTITVNDDTASGGTFTRNLLTLAVPQGSFAWAVSSAVAGVPTAYTDIKQYIRTSVTLAGAESMQIWTGLVDPTLSPGLF
jgi:hypothetical protein